MLSVSAAVRVFVCLEPTDMRRSFDGLAALAQSLCNSDPFEGGPDRRRRRIGEQKSRGRPAEEHNLIAKAAQPTSGSSDHLYIGMAG